MQPDTADSTSGRTGSRDENGMPYASSDNPPVRLTRQLQSSPPPART